MTRTTRRLGRTAALAGAAATAALLLAGTALADAAPDLVPGTPCTTSARACADLATNRAWLIHDGAVTRGPVRMSHGGAGEETPVGTFHVEWKDDKHVSSEEDVPMPYSVFFAEGGIAFHEGSPYRLSAGCVHLAHDDAEAWYDDLHVGDEVQVH